MDFLLTLAMAIILYIICLLHVCVQYSMTVAFVIGEIRDRLVVEKMWLCRCGCASCATHSDNELGLGKQAAETRNKISRAYNA